MHPELNKYKHKFQLRVRNFDVDSQGIVHNAIYLEYCETGRVEYIRDLGFKLLPGGVFDNGIKVMVRRNEINYYNPARIDDLIDVYTRVAYIKSSSFCFEHILLNSGNGLLCCDQKSIQVNLNPDTNLPERLNDKYRNMLIGFEGSNLEIIK
jgi:acyl-CoA thioester hydrolase